MEIGSNVVYTLDGIQYSGVILKMFGDKAIIQNENGEQKVMLLSQLK